MLLNDTFSSEGRCIIKDYSLLHPEEITKDKGDTFHIVTQGDVVFGKDQSAISLSKNNNESFINKEDVKLALKKLSDSIEILSKSLPNKQFEDIKTDFEIFSKEVTKDKPRRSWYELSAKGLIEAAVLIDSLGKPVVSATNYILNLIGK